MKGGRFQLSLDHSRQVKPEEKQSPQSLQQLFADMKKDWAVLFL